MKALRILFMVAVYSVTLPPFIIVGMGFIAWLCIKNKIECGETQFKILYAACVEGAKAGHKCNMIWVKYGNNYGVDEVIKEFGG